MSERSRRRARSLLLAVCANALLVSCASTPPPPLSPFEVLPGSWGWTTVDGSGCGENRHTIAFSEDRKWMLLDAEVAGAGDPGGSGVPGRYRIFETSPHLRVQREGEKRRTPRGAIVEWDLVILSPDQYCWHRSDWPRGSCTATNTRCG